MRCLWPAIFSFIDKDVLIIEMNQMNGFVFFSVILVIFERFFVDFGYFLQKKQRKISKKHKSIHLIHLYNQHIFINQAKNYRLQTLHVILACDMIWWIKINMSLR